MDDEETDFIPLAALVANVVRWISPLGEEHQEQSKRNAACQGADEDHASADR